MYSERKAQQFYLTDWRHTRTRTCTRTHAHTPKEMVAAAFIWPFSSGGKGELRAGADSCTCPPCVVWSSLSGGGTRTCRQQCSTKHQGTGTDQTKTPAGKTRLLLSPSSLRRLATYTSPSPPPRVEGTALRELPRDWTRGCRATSGRRSLVGQNTPSG